MQPNHLAFAACIVIIGAIWFVQLYRRLRAPLLVAGAVALYVLVETRSRATLIALVLGLTVYGLCSIQGNRYRRILPWATIGLLIVGPAVLPAVANWFDRGSASSLTTLTGRTDFWPLVVHMIRERPIIGWGVNAVASPPVAPAFQAITTEAVQAHNAFLEAALIGGIPGVVAWAASLIGMLIGSLRMPKETPYRALIVACTTVLLFESLTESNPAWQGDMFLIVALCAALYSDIRRRYVPIQWASISHPRVRRMSLLPSLASSGSAVHITGAYHPAVPATGDGGGAYRPPWNPSQLVSDLLPMTMSSPQSSTKDYVRRLRGDGHIVTRATVATILGAHGLSLRSQRIRASNRRRER